MKLKSVYVCQNCGAQSPKWTGRCLDCGQWNTLQEDVINVGKAEKTPTLRGRAPSEAPHPMTAKLGLKDRRTTSGLEELDRVLGGGFVDGSLTLLSGEPGIGKSTLTLQILKFLTEAKASALYVSGEESVDQILDRASRLNCLDERANVVYETQIERVLELLETQKPGFLVVDSVQVMYSSEIPGYPGSISQVRTITEQVMGHVKRMNIPTLLIGHVNKEGQLAGPKVLEHLVDTVLLLEGQRDQSMRILRAVKNRFGTVSEVGLFEMDEAGLRELKNPSEHILLHRPKNAAGSMLTMSLEGNRPLLYEVQALVSRTPFGYPKRSASGFDRNRLELLCAVLQKHTDLDLSDQDIFVNVVGGFSLSDPAADLAVCLAMASSALKRAVPDTLVAFGEVGLTGEIRPGLGEKTRQEACERMGLVRIPKASELKGLLKQLFS